MGNRPKPSVGDYLDLRYRNLQIGFRVREIEAAHVWLGPFVEDKPMFIGDDLTENKQVQVTVIGEISVPINALKPYSKPNTTTAAWIVDLTEMR